MEQQLLTESEVAPIMASSKSTVPHPCIAGELPKLKIGRGARIPRESEERWIASRTSSAIDKYQNPADGLIGARRSGPTSGDKEGRNAG
jgi:hypothetical protein